MFDEGLTRAEVLLIFLLFLKQNFWLIVVTDFVNLYSDQQGRVNKKYLTIT